MDMNDLIAIKEMVSDDDHRRCGCYDDCYRRRNGLGDTALALGASALGVVIFGGLGLYAYANQSAKTAYQLSNMTNQRVNDTIGAVGQLNNALLQESLNRQNGDNAMRGEYVAANNRVADKIDIVNSTASTASSVANAIANAESTLLTQSLLGNLNQCPQKVSIYSAPAPCACPAPAQSCGCGC